MINYIIWDAGGTLFNTYPAVVAAFRATLNDFAHDAPPERVRALCRVSTAHALETLAATFGLDANHFEMRYRRAYAASSPATQPPFPGVKRICAYIRESGGQNFIVTHRARASLDALLDAHGMAKDFTACITKDDTYPRKPDPASMLALIARYALNRAHCLAIGDRELDILAGQRVGMRTCFFTRAAAAARLHDTRADVNVANFEALYRWLLVENAGTTNWHQREHGKGKRDLEIAAT